MKIAQARFLITSIGFLSFVSQCAPKSIRLFSNVLLSVCSQREEFIESGQVQAPLKRALPYLPNLECGWFKRPKCEASKFNCTSKYQTCAELGINALSTGPPDRYYTERGVTKSFMGRFIKNARNDQCPTPEPCPTCPPCPICTTTEPTTTATTTTTSKTTTKRPRQTPPGPLTPPPPYTLRTAPPDFTRPPGIFTPNTGPRPVITPPAGIPTPGPGRPPYISPPPSTVTPYSKRYTFRPPVNTPFSIPRPTVKYTFSVIPWMGRGIHATFPQPRADPSTTPRTHECWCPSCPRCKRGDELYCKEESCGDCPDDETTTTTTTARPPNIPECKDCGKEKHLCLLCPTDYYPACRKKYW